MGAWGPRRLLVASVLAGALLLAAIPSPRAYAAPSFKTAECPVEVPPEHAHRVRCGVLTVPERRAEGPETGQTIRLPVAIIASFSASPASDPLVFPTMGGPGAGALEGLEHFLDFADWAADERDIILMEQRGDKLADPSLDCTEFDAANQVFDDPPTIDPRPVLPYVEKLMECRERLTAHGVDLAAYTTAASAADLADLRTALGYDAWNLYGTSYGSRLALVTMRDRPEGLRSVILDGAYPPNINAYEETAVGYLGAVRAMINACDADPRCQSRYPDLERSLVTVLARAREAPLVLAVKHPHDQSPIRLTVRDADITEGLFDALYDPNLVRVLPFIIDQLALGNDDVALPLAQQSVNNADWFAEGLNTGINCAEQAPFVDEERRTASYTGSPLLVHQDLHPFRSQECAAWNVPRASASVTEAVVSDIPTLLTSGGHDPVTPPTNAEIAARGLSRHYAYTFPSMGHGTVWSPWLDPCPAAIAKQFLHDPNAVPDSSCISAAQPPRFLTTDDIRVTSAIYRLNSDAIEARDPLQISLLAVTLCVLVAGAGIGVASVASRKARRRAAGMMPAVVMALVVSVLHLGFAVGLILVVLTSDPLILGFGIPSGARPLALLAIGGMAASVALLVLLARAWARQQGTRFNRLAASAVLVAALAFAGWVLSRGLVIL